MKKIFLLVLSLVLVSSFSLAQLTAGKMAFTTTLGPGTAIGGAYALSENMRVNGALEFNSSDAGAGSQTTIGLGAGVWLYQPAMENVTMFYGGGLSFETTNTSPNSSNNLGIMVSAGAEYWFSSRFTMGGGINFGFGSGKTAAGTSTSNFGTLGGFTTMSWWFN